MCWLGGDRVCWTLWSLIRSRATRRLLLRTFRPVALCARLCRWCSSGRVGVMKSSPWLQVTLVENVLCLTR